MRVNAPSRINPWLLLESLVQPTCLYSSLHYVHQGDPEVPIRCLSLAPGPSAVAHTPAHLAPTSTPQPSPQWAAAGASEVA